MTILGAITFAVAPHSLRAQADGLPIGAPVLQRMVVWELKSFAIDFADPRARAWRSLVMVDSIKPQDQQTISVFVFGRNLSIDAVTGKIFPPRGDDPFTALPHRWTIGGESVFAAWRLGFGFDVLRYPMHAFAVEPDDTRIFYNSRIEGLTKIEGPTMRIVGGMKDRHTWLSPIFSHQTGIRGWKEGDEEMRPGLTIGAPPQVFQYDIRALDDVRIELYMTADGKLQRWLFDGEKWRLQKNYSVQIHGPFLVCKGGAAAVAEREGHWCLIEPLDADEPRARRIVQKVEDTPLVLVEDVFGRATFFEQQDKLYDERGVVRWSAPAVLDTPAKTKAIADYVCSVRSRQR
jgi:hypothetical protein